MEPWETETRQPVERQSIVPVPMPVEDWLAVGKAWDTYEYCCILEALLLGKRITLWRAN